jgi:hypothetical protein
VAKEFTLTIVNDFKLASLSWFNGSRRKLGNGATTRRNRLVNYQRLVTRIRKLEHRLLSFAFKESAKIMRCLVKFNFSLSEGAKTAKTE